LRHQESLKETIAKQKLTIEQLQSELSQRDEAEKAACSRTLSQIQSQNAVRERELSLLHSTEAAPLDDRQLELAALRTRLELSGESSDASAEQVRRLQAEIDRLQAVLDQERVASVQRLKDSRMKALEEYEALVAHLKKRCDDQKATIESLLAERKGDGRARRGCC
jgi:hypothetical protein